MSEQYQPISADTVADTILSASQSSVEQPEGKGMRIANKAEFTLLAPVLQPDGAATFRKRAAKAQTEAGYGEGQLGTVHDLRVALVNDDRWILFAATYSDDFKPYVADVIKFATPWIDYMFGGVAEGYPGLASAEAIPYILKYQVEAQVWYASHADLSPRDITRSVRLSSALDALFDAAQS